MSATGNRLAGTGPADPADPAGPEVFRLTAPVALWWIWVAFAVANLVDLAVQGSPGHTALVIGAVMLLVTGLAYTLALRPRVVAGRAGLTIVNPFRDHHVPWTAIQRVDAGDWVRVHCESRAIECWALYVPARAKRREARPALPVPPSRFRGFGQQQADEMARLPQEARHLASLPAAKAIASRLDTRAAKERAKQSQGGRPGQATTRWALWPLAAVAAPAAAVAIVILG